jgi:hypothetical protein
VVRAVQGSVVECEDMDKPDTNPIVAASRELGRSFTEAAGLVGGVSEGVKEVNQLYDHGYGGAGKSMVRLGVALVMVPEPLLILDVVGGGFIAAGLVYNRVSPPPMYVDDVFRSIAEQVKAIHLMGEDLSRNFSVSVDFSSKRFQL